MRGMGLGGGGRVVWVSGRFASQHRWCFVWSLPREQGSKEKGQREESMGELEHTQTYIIG